MKLNQFFKLLESKKFTDYVVYIRYKYLLLISHKSNKNNHKSIIPKLTISTIVNLGIFMPNIMKGVIADEKSYYL